MSELRPLTERIALVTGGGRGIGAAVGWALARAGAEIVLAARTAAEVDEVAAAIRAQGLRAHARTLDVADPAQVEALAASLARELGPVQILVNNAGVSGSAPVHRTSVEEWDRMMVVNARGPFLLIRAFLPAMLEQGWGRIVNVASEAGLTGARYVAAYTASKHAVVGLTRAVAAEVAGTGVTVNALCPGYVDTPMTDETVRHISRVTGRSGDDARASILAMTPHGRLITPEEVADAALALCLDAETQGEAIRIHGGDRP